MADIVLPPKVVFFVEAANPTARIEMTTPRMVKPHHQQRVKLGQAFYECACGARDVHLEPGGTTQGGVSGHAPYWRSKLDDHKLGCAFREHAAARRERTESKRPSPTQALKKDGALVLSMNALPRGQTYDYNRLKRNGISQKAVPYIAAVKGFGADYAPVSIKDMKTLVNKLAFAVKMSSGLDTTNVSSGGALRPIQRLFVDPVAGPGILLPELAQTAVCLEKREETLRLEKDRPGQRRKPSVPKERQTLQETLAPRLFRIVPSQKQLQSLKDGEGDGQISRDTLPAIIGAGFEQSEGHKPNKNTQLANHEVVFADVETRAAAAKALVQGEEVWAIGYPRVTNNSYRKIEIPHTGHRYEIDYKMAVPAGMIHVGPLPPAVMAALRQPYIDVLSNPQQAKVQRALAPAA